MQSARDEQITIMTVMSLIKRIRPEVMNAAETIGLLSEFANTNYARGRRDAFEQSGDEIRRHSDKPVDEIEALVRTLALTPPPLPVSRSEQRRVQFSQPSHK